MRRQPRALAATASAAAAERAAAGDAVERLAMTKSKPGFGTARLSMPRSAPKKTIVCGEAALGAQLGDGEAREQVPAGAAPGERDPHRLYRSRSSRDSDSSSPPMPGTP